MPNLDNNPSKSTLKAPRQRRKNKETANTPSKKSMSKFSRHDAVSSSLESIHIPPRTPRTGSHERGGNGDEEVELSLLNADEQRAAAVGAANDLDKPTSRQKAGLSVKDRQGMILLIVLCMYI